MRPSISIPLLLAISLANAQDVTDILTRHVEAEKKNDARAQQYVYTSRQVQFQFDKQGNVKSSHAKTFDEMFVEGQPYRKLVAEEDQPLSAREAAKEEARQRQTAEERRQARRNGMFHKTVSTAKSEELLTLYSCHADGEADLAGRRAWIFQCDPRTDRAPANDHEKEALTFRQRLWIDQTDLVSLKVVNTAIEGNPTLMPGSTMTFEYGFINNDAWLPVTLVIDGHAQFAKLFKPQVRTEYKYTNFKKFDVQSTITPDSN